MQILKEEVKSKILSHSTKIFMKNGYKNATMRDIAASSNISVGNIYRYFKNKDSILDELINDFENELKDFNYSFKTDIFKNSPNEIYDKFINEMIALFKKHRFELGLLSQNIANKKLKRIKNAIEDSMSEKMMIVAKTLKKKNFTKTVANAITAGILEGIKTILLESKEFDENVEKDMKIYLNFILGDLNFRIKEM